MSRLPRPLAIGAARIAILLVLAVAAIVVVVVAVRPAPAPSRSAYPVITPTAVSPSALVIGGTVAAGNGASDTSKTWPVLVSRARGWSTVLLTGDRGDVFSVRAKCTDCVDWRAVLSSAVLAQPRIVVVVGQVEAGADSATVIASSSALISGLRRALPDATIVVVGPPGGDAARARALTGSLASISSAAGARFVNLASPELPAGSVSADGAGLTDSGQSELARRIGTALSS